MADGQTIVVWGEEQEKSRYISINGESDVTTLLKAVTEISLNHLVFYDEDEIKFANVDGATKVKEIGRFDANKRVWIVTIKPKQVRCV